MTGQNPIYLTDHTGRMVDYLRISVTNRCNLRCSYCITPPRDNGKKREDLLNYEELMRLIKILVPLGISKIRITGGEPLARKDLPLFLVMIKKFAPDVELCITTNGILITKYLEGLQRAGIDRLNVSLDTLKAGRFKEITGHDSLDQVLEGINEIIRKEIFPVKINVLLIPGVNTDEIDDFIEFARINPVEIRFIEKMPIGNCKEIDYVPASHVYAVLKEKIGETRGTRAKGETSLTFEVKGFTGKIGLIAPLSRSFCADCNRLRITAEGDILNCLLDGTPIGLRSAIRNGCDNSEILAAITRALSEKPVRYDRECLFGVGRTQRCMTNIGG